METYNYFVKPCSSWMGDKEIKKIKETPINVTSEDGEAESEVEDLISVAESLFEYEDYDGHLGENWEGALVCFIKKSEIDSLFEDEENSKKTWKELSKMLPNKHWFKVYFDTTVTYSAQEL